MLLKRAALFLILITLSSSCADSPMQNSSSFQDPEMKDATGTVASEAEYNENEKSSGKSLKDESSPQGIVSTKSTEFHLSADEKNWKQIDDEDGILAFRGKNSVNGVVAFRGEATVPTPLLKIAAVLNDFSNRKEWVDSLVETKLIEVKSRFDRIEYNHSKVPWPFQDRDFVYSVNVKVNHYPTSMLITMKSIEDARAPAVDGVVRGQILYSYYYMQELPGKEPATRVVIEMALDPKGAIPLWMVNMTQKKWPHNTLLALKRMAMKPDLVVPKEISDYFSQNKKTRKKGKK